MASPATHEDAKLLLQLYDLRREKRLRQARDFVQRDCKFKDYKDFQKRYPEGSKQATYIGMVLGYWDMACTLVEKGLIAEDLFNATNYEHVWMWQKLRPLIEAWRKQYSFPAYAAALEAVANRHPAAAVEDTTASKGRKAKKLSAKAEDSSRRARPRQIEDEEEAAEHDADAEPDDDEDDD